MYWCMFNMPIRKVTIDKYQRDMQHPWKQELTALCFLLQNDVISEIES